MILKSESELVSLQLCRFIVLNRFTRAKNTAFDAHRVERNSHYFRCYIVQGEIMSSEPVESYCVLVAHPTCNVYRGKVF